MLIPVAYAQEEQIVSCGGLDCTLCHLVETVQKAFNALLTVSFAVAVLFVIIGGFIYIYSRGQDEWMGKAKKAITGSLIGFGIALGSWLAVNVAFYLMGATNQGNWWSIDCESTTGAVSGSESISSIVSAANGSGKLSTYVDQGVDKDDLYALYNNVGTSDMLLFGVDTSKGWVPLAIVGKGTSGPEIFYVNMSMMKAMAKSAVSYFPLINTARADTSSDIQEQVREKAKEALEIIFDFMAAWMIEHTDINAAITTRPQNIQLNPESIPKNYPDSLTSLVGDMKKCFESGGAWYRFNNACDLEKTRCARKQCDPSEKAGVYDGCICPEGKCVKDGKCREN